MPDTLADAARSLGMRTLWQSGLDRIWRGQTSLEEVVRVLGDRAGDEPAVIAAEPIPLKDLLPNLLAPTPGDVASDPAAAEVSPPPAPVPREAPTTQPPSAPRILVADDDAQMRKLVRLILKREGFAVEEAADGLDALEVMDTHPVDLLILDLDMPRLDGLGVLEELRARVLTSSIPVIVLTARSDDTEVKALDLGAQDYLTKPVQPSSLAARVKAVLRRSRL